MGLVELMDKAEKDEALCNYEFTMVTAADELLGKMVSGDLDIALVPANVASVLYNKTQGGISVLDINTLGVLDIVASDSSIQSIADLKGKTLYLTGKGTSPDYVIRYLLSENGLSESDVTLEYKSEPTEVAAVLKEHPDAIGLLPQPFVTVAQSKIDGLRMALDLTEEWDKLDNGSALITGVIVARSDFVEAHPAAVGSFLTAYAASVDWVNANTADAAALIGEYGIVDAAVAEKALPYCNIVCITGAELLEKLPGYLSVLYNADPAAVGGAMPDNSFYFA